jgi:hypothetical protein
MNSSTNFQPPTRDANLSQNLQKERLDHDVSSMTPLSVYTETNLRKRPAMMDDHQCVNVGKR